ncbi:putative thiol oxidase [Dioscorea sansibarensis]
MNQKRRAKRGKLTGNENPVEAFLHCCTSVAHSLHFHLSLFFPTPYEPSSKGSPSQDTKLVLLSVSPHESIQKPVAAPLTKEEFGRATWTLLHTIAAQFPDSPMRQQKHDAKELSKSCGAGSLAELSKWLYHVHKPREACFSLPENDGTSLIARITPVICKALQASAVKLY